MISWTIILFILGIMVCLVAVQTHLITKAYLGHAAEMVVALAVYLLFVCCLISGIIWLVWRKTTGRPLRRIANAARRVASGDFGVQVQSSHKSAKMNEIDVLIEDFNKMTRELAANEMLKSDFIANVSHEIKTPIAVIQSYSKALRDGRVPEQQRGQYLETIVEASGRLNAMVANVLKISKLESQQIFPNPRTYQLGEQLRHCALAFMERWEDKGIEFSVDVTDVAVCYDASLMELVWNNLLSNAIKYTEPGGSVSLTSWVEGSQGKGVVVVAVRDAGCGMDEKTRQQVFEKFYQGDTSHASEGNGLGLALAKKVIDIVDGQISVESSSGKGTTFTVRLKI